MSSGPLWALFHLGSCGKAVSEPAEPHVGLQWSDESQKMLGLLVVNSQGGSMDKRVSGVPEDVCTPIASWEVDSAHAPKIGSLFLLARAT